jgi:hypothetical protein
MTMQIVENWADVNGKLLNTQPSKTADGFVTLEVKVSDVKDVESFRNLLNDKQGEVIQVNVPESLWREMEKNPGTTVSARVRMGPARKLFVHPERLKVE